MPLANSPFETDSLNLLQTAVARLQEGFAELPADSAGSEQGAPGGAGRDAQRMGEVLLQVADRLQDNFPYQHPLYAGQMLKPPHPMARLAYMLALWINPNNHALDGGRASSAMEKEAVAAIAAMYGWGDQYLGHLSSAGTTANLEALWVAGQLHPGRLIVASEQAHYTHSRLSGVLQLGFAAVPTDSCGRMDMSALEALLQAGEVGTVVVTLGTTGAGAVDPLPKVLELQQRYAFRIHVDAAYGGYFKLAGNLDAAASAAFACIDRADSIVVDPHKCGLQPYGCGCILFRDPSVGRIYQHDSPYTYFSSDQLHLGEISLECSRAGASAVALWATQQLLPMSPGGEFARDLEKSRSAALDLYQRLLQDPHELTLFAPELDIVLWAPRADTAAEISRLSQHCFDAAAAHHLHLALVKLPAALLRPHWPQVNFDLDTVTCLRSCLMKPEHQQWLQRIWSIYKTIREEC